MVANSRKDLAQTMRLNALVSIMSKADKLEELTKDESIPAEARQCIAFALGEGFAAGIKPEDARRAVDTAKKIAMEGLPGSSGFDHMMKSLKG